MSAASSSKGLPLRRRYARRPSPARGGQAHRRIKELEGYHDALGKRVAEALDTPARRTPKGLALANEVRAHIKALPESRRWSFVAEAIQVGDRATVAAVLAAPRTIPLLPYCSSSAALLQVMR